MVTRWRETAVSEIAVPVRGTASGPFGSSISKKFFVSEGVPVIRGNNLSLGTNGPRFHDDGFVYLTDNKANELSAAECLPGDLVFTARGTIGQVGLIPRNSRFRRYVLSANQLRLRANPEIADSLYLYYWFSSAQMVAVMQARNAGSALPNMNLGALRGLPVILPSLPEQRAIARILGALDDKIELNRRMNETLEAMARALFKSWFIDFDPVHAKAEGRDPGLPADIAALFPDSFEDSDLGEIPRGWEIGIVQDLAEVSSGKRPGVRYPEVSVLARVPLWGGSGPMAFVPDTLIDYPFLLTGRVGTLGSVFRITEPCWPSDNTLILKTKQRWAFEYLFLQLKRIDFAALNRGSTQPLLTQSDLKAQPLLTPPIAVLEYFHVFVGSLYKHIDELKGEADTLAALRDTLLPKLLSGELQVKDVQRLGEAS